MGKSRTFAAVALGIFIGLIVSFVLNNSSLKSRSSTFYDTTTITDYDTQKPIHIDLPVFAYGAPLKWSLAYPSGVIKNNYGKLIANYLIITSFSITAMLLLAKITGKNT